MFKGVFSKVSDFLEAKLDILKLTLIEKAAILLGFIMLMMFGVSCMLTILIILGMGLSSYFADLTGSVPGGYFLTAGVYFLLMVLSMLFKKQLLKLLAGLFINIMTDDLDKDILN